MRFTVPQAISYDDRGINRNSRRKGWVNPGYHYVVSPDGKITQLLDEDKVSNGVRGYNSETINVAYIGGIDTNGKPTDNRTDAQKASLRSLLKMLHKKYPTAVIQGHRDFSPDLNKDGKITSNEWMKLVRVLTLKRSMLIFSKR